jgi:hypothetical protein
MPYGMTRGFQLPLSVGIQPLKVSARGGKVRILTLRSRSARQVETDGLTNRALRA